MTTRRNIAWVVIVITIISTLVLFLRLPRTPLTNWDEGIYAGVTQTIHAGGSWWLPTYHGQLFLEKPPLTFWLMNLSFDVFGVNELGVRFWSALAGIATALLITVWTWQATPPNPPLSKGGNHRAWLALLAGLLFVSGRFMFFHAFRTGDTDALLVFFVTATLYAYWRTKDDQRWWWAVGIFTGLAIMTKSFVGLLPQLIIDLDLLVSRGYRHTSWRRAMQGLGLLLLVAAPWHIVVGLTHGRELWHQAVGFNLVERSSAIIASANVPGYWYGKVFLDFFFPASFFIAWAVLVALNQRKEPLNRLLLIWAGVTIILFSLARTKYDHYIQPLYPAASLLIALAFIHGLAEQPRRWLWVVFELSTAWMIAAMPAHLAHSGLLWNLTPYGFLPVAWATHAMFRWLVALIAALIVVTIARVLQPRLAPLIVGAAMAAYVVILSFGWQYSYLKHLPTTSNAKAIAAQVISIHPQDIRVIDISHLSEPALYFYLARIGVPITEATSAARFEGSTIITTITLSPTLQHQGYHQVFHQGPYVALRQ